FRHPAHQRDVGLRPRELPAHHHREQSADDQHEQPEEQELAADHLVIGRKKILAYEAELVMSLCVRRVRRRLFSHRFSPLGSDLKMPAEAISPAMSPAATWRKLPGCRRRAS